MVIIDGSKRICNDAYMNKFIGLGIMPQAVLDHEYRGYVIRRYKNAAGEPCWFIVGMEEHCGPEGFASVYQAKAAVDNMEAAICS